MWSVEARLEFNKDKRGPAKVRLNVPRLPPGLVILDENFVSGRYGLSSKDKGDNRVLLWAARRVSGKQVLYYHLQLAPAESVDGREQESKKESRPAFPKVPDYPDYMRSTVNTFLGEVRSKSADTASFARELLERLNHDQSDDNVALLMKNADKADKRVARLRYILAGARIPTRVVHVLELKDGLRHGKLAPWLQVFNGRGWITYDSDGKEQEISKSGLLWQIGDDPVFEVGAIKNAKLEFSVSRHTQESVLVAERLARKLGSRVMEFSLFSLPVQTQNVYRILLMVPLGAFLMVILRNVVGIMTFGTFMPILIALSFRETELLWGVVFFSLLVSLGLLLRFYLEYLQLLLVPRLASVLIIVILLMATVSILSHKLGIERGLSIALFPMVILAMTIERMSLIWEERGPAEAIKQGLGTLLVAACGYLVMTSELLNHIIFVFPELLLVLLATTLLLGRYTGYRLTELWRFRAALKGK